MFLCRIVGRQCLQACQISMNRIERRTIWIRIRSLSRDQVSPLPGFGVGECCQGIAEGIKHLMGVNHEGLIRESWRILRCESHPLARRTANVKTNPAVAPFPTGQSMIAPSTPFWSSGLRRLVAGPRHDQGQSKPSVLRIGLPNPCPASHRQQPRAVIRFRDLVIS